MLWPKFTRFRGDTKRLSFTLTDDNGAIVKPDDCTLFFSVNDSSGNPLVQKQSTIGGFTTIDNNNGVVEVEIVPADDAALSNDLNYDCVLVAQNNTTQDIARVVGTLRLRNGILGSPPAITLSTTTTNPASGFLWGNIPDKPVAITSLAALTPAANKLAYFTGGSTAALTDLTAFGRRFIAAADSSSAKTLLSLVKADVGLSL
ncbi:MAG: hypothetical protein KGL39_48430, partial [Patescibacteria group bacterium]|nr:hypothetical protein [Patescibacteria group bacterium]